MNDLRFALRQLIRRPGVSVIAVMTLAVGLGASTAIFTVVNSVLLQPLPYPGGERVVRVLHVNDAGARYNLSDPDFADLRDQTAALDGVAQFGAAPVSVSGGNQPTRSMRALVSEDFFRVLGVTPTLGRAFSPEERRPDATPAVIVSAHYWQHYLDADPDFTQRSLRLDDRHHTIVGVMPPGFAYPDGADLWVPQELLPANTSRTAHNWSAAARLAAGTSLTEAQAEMDLIAGALRAAHGEDRSPAGIALVSLLEFTVGGLRPMLMLLLGASVLLFLIAWANVASLLLARAGARRRELAIRVAVGAGRARLTRQFLLETLLVALLGGLVGLVIAYLSLELFQWLLPAGMPRHDSIAIDGRALLFTVALALGAALALGLVIAAHAARGNIALGAGRHGTGSHRSVGTRVLVIGQMALALVLLVGAGILGRSFYQLMQVDPGFRTDSTLVMRLALPHSRAEAEHARQAQFHQRLLAEIRALPGIQRAAAVNLLPVAPGQWNGTFLKLTRADEVTDFESWETLFRTPGRTGQAEYRIVTSDYFETLGIPLLDGRVFDHGDQPHSTHVAVISESLARAHWPDENPLGRLVHFGNMDGNLKPFTVVGVVADIHDAGLEQPPGRIIYGYYRQRQSALAQLSYVMRTDGDPLGMAPRVREVLAELDPELPPAFTTLSEVMHGSVAQRRFAFALVTAFGAGALGLALVGVYGAVAFSVSRRQREIGVRMALGADRHRVVALVVGEGLRMTLIGVALGTGAALLLARTADSLVYGITSTDPATLVAGCAVLLLAAVVAAWLPARRAARVDPVHSLRQS